MNILRTSIFSIAWDGHPNPMGLWIEKGTMLEMGPPMRGWSVLRLFGLRIEWVRRRREKNRVDP
jgi:hypothetical protein